jgi:hypothetical protein
VGIGIAHYCCAQKFYFRRELELPIQKQASPKIKTLFQAKIFCAQKTLAWKAILSFDAPNCPKFTKNHTKCLHWFVGTTLDMGQNFSGHLWTS